MQTVEKPFSAFLSENADHLLELCVKEGFRFSVKESSCCVTVRCTLPDGYIRFIVFDDHRIQNPHGGKPHVCNQWHKAIGEPVSYTLGKEITDVSQLQRILRTTAVMCLTQSEGYIEMKSQVFL